MSSNFDEYEVIKQLAKGGQGTTSCVKKKSNGLRFVLKQTQCESVRIGNVALQEAKTLQGLTHHSVVQYFDVFLHSGNGYLIVCTIMELCNRGDLANYLFDKRRRQSPLTEQVVRSWLSQLSDALAYLHANKILHRDLKPHNVFLTSEGILKVGDFGLSATLENGKRTSHVGTPCYLAPEVMNHEAYGEAVDMWGAGCIGYEMVTLQFLWEKKGLLAASVKTQPLRAEDLPERFSPAIRECIVSCLQFTPGNRPRASALLSKVRASKRGGSDDASALAKALEGFVGSDALNGVVDSMRKQFESFSGLLFGGNSEPEIERPAALSVVRPIVPATEKTSDLLGHLDSDKDQGRDGPQGARGGGARGQGRSPGGSIGV